MLYYSFSVVTGEEFKKQARLIPENNEVVSDRSDELATKFLSCVQN